MFENLSVCSGRIKKTVGYHRNMKYSHFNIEYFQIPKHFVGGVNISVFHTDIFELLQWFQ